MSDNVQDPQEGLSRRQVLTRAAFAGAVVWATPVVQSINPSRAWAAGVGSPLQVCQSVIIDSSGNCSDTQSGYTHISPTGETGGCGFVTTSPDPFGGIVFGVAPGGEVVDGAVVGADGSSSAPISSASGDLWKASPGPSGIDHVEITICVAEGAAPTGPTASGPSGPTASGPSGPTASGPSGPTASGPSGPTASGPSGPTASGPSGPTSP